MKRLYIICFVTLALLFASCYCIGYYTVIYNSEEPTKARDYYEVRQAGASSESIVKRDTEIIVEEYVIDTGTITEYNITPEIDVLGLDRAQYGAVLRKYMEAPSQEDVNRGILSMELVEFSAERIVIRKSFDLPDYNPSGNFILYAVDGKVVIYYEDFVTIYDYTDIEVTKLNTTLQREIYAGKMIETLEELYEFLEEHTS